MAMKRISVKEGIPEHRGRFLILLKCKKHEHNHGMYNGPYPCCDVNIAYFNARSKEWEYSFYNTEIVEPSHWMFIPPVPKDWKES
jgi:hypothetical protein